MQNLHRSNRNHEYQLHVAEGSTMVRGRRVL